MENIVGHLALPVQTCTFDYQHLDNGGAAMSFGLPLIKDGVSLLPLVGFIVS